jgi:hypothetical protein
MSLESIRLVVDILSGLGVVVSLIYVGVQIRQSARATRLAAVQAFTQALGRSEEMIIQDGGFTEILKHGLAGNTHALPDTDRIRLNIFYRNALRTFQSAYYQYRNGALEAAVWEPQGRSLAGIFQADRGLREFYEVEKYMLIRHSPNSVNAY